MKNNSSEWVKSAYLSEITVSYKHKTLPEMQPLLNNPEVTYQYLRAVWDDDTLDLVEEAYILLLSCSHRVLGWCKINTGTKSTTIIDVPRILAIALQSNASNVIMGHNHPSGTLKASFQDKQITQRIANGLTTVGINLSDHLIVTRSGFLSFVTEGLMPNQQINGMG